MADWDGRWMRLAAEVGSWSKDRSTKVGCIAIDNERRLLTAGYNGFPRGVNDDVESRHERPEKYLFVEHAERNAISNAARSGVSLYESRMYCTLYPCADCAKGIIQAGVAVLLTPEPDWDLPNWSASFRVSKAMLEEAEVETRFLAVVP
jgi:dCMP deaminase